MYIYRERLPMQRSCLKMEDFIRVRNQKGISKSKAIMQRLQPMPYDACSCWTDTQCPAPSLNRMRPVKTSYVLHELTRSRSLPSSSISVTNFSMGWAGLEWKACLGRATSLGQSSSPGSPITLRKNHMWMWALPAMWRVFLLQSRESKTIQSRQAETGPKRTSFLWFEGCLTSLCLMAIWWSWGQGSSHRVTITFIGRR